MGMSECPEYFQSDEKGASHTLRNACRRCGRTKEAHERQKLPSYLMADEWLESKGYQKMPYYELAKNLLTHYIEDSREDF